MLDFCARSGSTNTKKLNFMGAGGMIQWVYSLSWFNSSIPFDQSEPIKSDTLASSPEHH